MAEISTTAITKDFSLNNIRQFIESISEKANTAYYVFAGNPLPYADDNNPNTVDLSVEYLRTRAYDEMVFAKKISANDVKPMIKRINWENGTVYDMYDSSLTDLSDKNFYVLSKEGDSYYVFICLDNNFNAKSVSQPLFSSTSVQDSYYETADGYVWKYLYTIDRTTFEKFSTTEYIPVIPDSEVVSRAVKGSLDIIKIENKGIRYNNNLEGVFFPTDVTIGGTPTLYKLSGTNVSDKGDFYTDSIIKIIEGVGSGQYREILAYNAATRIITIDSAFTTIPNLSKYEIMPKVEIIGDGRETEKAEARAIVDENQSNAVIKIDILNPGKGYFKATARVLASAEARDATEVNNAELRPIIPPRFGHGYDVASQLYATRVGISIKFDKDENGEMPISNDYRTVGILKDPLYSRVRLENSGGGSEGLNFIDEEDVYELNLTRLAGSVTVSTSNLEIAQVGTLNVIQYDNTTPINVGEIDTFLNTDRIRVSNAVVDAIATVTVTPDPQGNLESINLISLGYGFVDAENIVINSETQAKDNVIYFNSFVMTNNYLTIANGGNNYSTGDYIEIYSPLTSSRIAKGTIDTNGGDDIVYINMNNSGSEFDRNGIAHIPITNSGLGYANVYTEQGGNNQLDITIASNFHNPIDLPTAIVVGKPYANISYNTITLSTNDIIYMSNTTGIVAKGKVITTDGTTANVEIYSGNTYFLDQLTIFTGYYVSANGFPTTAGGLTSYRDESIISEIQITDPGYGFAANSVFTIAMNDDNQGTAVSFAAGTPIFQSNGVTYDVYNSAGVLAHGKYVTQVDVIDSGSTNLYSNSDILFIRNEYNQDFAIANVNISYDAYANVYANSITGTFSIGESITFNDVNLNQVATAIVVANTNMTGDNTLYISQTTGDIFANSITYANTAAGDSFTLNYMESKLEYDGSLGSISNITGNNFSFSGANGTVTYVANSDGGYIRYTDTVLVRDVAINNASPNQEVNDVTFTAAGSGYRDDAVSSIVVVNPGIGYDSTAGNSLTLSGTATATFANDALGRITEVTVTGAGSGYSAEPTITIPTVSGGTGADFRVYMSNELIVTANGDSGSGAVITFSTTANPGQIADFTVANSGFGYTQKPTISFRAIPGVTAGSGNDPDVQLVGRANNYVDAQDVLVCSAGGAAEADANTAANISANSTGYITAFDITHAGIGFENLLSSQIDIYATNTYNSDTYIKHISSSDTNITVLKNVTVGSPNPGKGDSFYNSEIDVFVAEGTIENAEGTIVNTAGFLSGITVTNTGKGVGTPDTIAMRIQQSDGNHIRYLNSNIVTSAVIDDGGEGYSNTDYIIISNLDGSGLPANLGIITDSSGVITALKTDPTTRGKDLQPAYISEITVGSVGTFTASNGDILEICGGGSSANVSINTNTDGTLKQFYIADGGSNYYCTPSSNSLVSDAGTDLNFRIIKPYKVRIYNSIDNLSSGRSAVVHPIIEQSVSANVQIAYAPIVTANLVSSAVLDVSLEESANIFFTTQQSPLVLPDLTGFPTSFISSLEDGDYLYLQTTNDSDFIQIDQIANNTHLRLKSYPNFTSNRTAFSKAAVRASGQIIDKSTNYVEVTNVKGIFNEGSEVFGLSSKAGLDITNITYNGVPKDGTVINQMVTYQGSHNFSNSAADEIIRAFANNNGGFGTAYFHSANDSHIYVVSSETDIFYADETYVTDSGASITMASGTSYKYDGDLVRGSGDLIYFENITPISRSTDQSETIKLIVEF